MEVELNIIESFINPTKLKVKLNIVNDFINIVELEVELNIVSGFINPAKLKVDPNHWSVVPMNVPMNILHRITSVA